MTAIQTRALLLSFMFAVACDQKDPGTGEMATTAGSSGTPMTMGGAGAPAPAGTGAGGASGMMASGPVSTPNVTAGAPAMMGNVGPAGAPAAGAPAAGAPAPMQTTGSLFPIKTGNSWTFRTTKGTEVGTKTQTVGALEMVGGTGPKSAVMAYKLVTTKADGTDKTESWQAELDGRIVRYRELAYARTGEVELEEHWDPYKLRVDGTQLTAGAMYTERYRETKIMAGAAPMTSEPSDTWKVVSLEEQVTVPAGTFSAVLIEKAGGTSVKRYWFVRGIGKVKEQSGTQLEELTSCMVDGKSVGM